MTRCISYPHVRELREELSVAPHLKQADQHVGRRGEILRGQRPRLGERVEGVVEIGKSHVSESCEIEQDRPVLPIRRLGELRGRLADNASQRRAIEMSRRIEELVPVPRGQRLCF